MTNEDESAGVINTLSPIVQALRAGLGDDLVAVALFGSRARGEATPESDWDVLVIARNLPERVMKRHALLKGLVPDTWYDNLSILGRTPQEFESHLPALYLEIALDGIVLFDTDGYLTQRLAKLRAAIERLGLERQMEGGETRWRWRSHPPPKWAIEWESVL